ncbi:DUF1343 domain-containing protein [Sandaracinomonas limnophila]|uniref:DUF1343 domain-containing protein n=1 Tax=Sandaracinomonas limnophila TaxID=1862386 RepID=A0A437PXF5_9BACT|nr:DUF1343 domain-containing protein [Sandaracinomonas limnophila]RVU26956.1 DUF1343 domain-containing protein [Sandaracinomonas limnophila]
MLRYLQMIVIFLGLSTAIFAQKYKTFLPAAAHFESYLPIIKDKKVGLVVNQTSMVGKKHLLDTLLSRGVQVTKIFGPEHGFRGKADAGSHLENEIDASTKLPIISLYGKHNKPSKEDLAGLDYLIFDIQDIGVRFYTYSSTLHLVMEACAENKIPLLVLDRANPHANEVAGPVLNRKFSSFVGMNPIPLIYGCTSGELAQMINGEGWLNNGMKCQLTVIPVSNYKRKSKVHLEVAPSPNLPNDVSIALYPSICLFEPTLVSVGRGTELPFQVIGTPATKIGNYEFTPLPKPGAMDPVMKNQLCYGYDFRNDLALQEGFSLKYLIEFFNKINQGDKFFTSPSFFDKLAGTDQLRLQLLQNISEKEIEASWEKDLKSYLVLRKKYLLYK